MNLSSETLQLACNGLKKIALDPTSRAAFHEGTLFKDLFKRSAMRYLISETQENLFEKLSILHSKGYELGVEYVGEENRDIHTISKFVNEYLNLLSNYRKITFSPQLGFDLSAVGMLISQDLAIENTTKILDAAAKLNVNIIISMEQSSQVDNILNIFENLAPKHENIGFTLQAQLHRTEDDLQSIIKHDRKIRLVKGVYNENPKIALHRGVKLNRRYMTLLETITSKHDKLACATQDQKLLNSLADCGLLKHVIEVEMLHGVQPNVIKNLREQGITCRISTVYGENWFLHFLHRLAESPTNLLESLADFYYPDRLVFAEHY